MSKFAAKAASVAVLSAAVVTNLVLWVAILASLAWLADAASSVVTAATGWAATLG